MPEGAEGNGEAPAKKKPPIMMIGIVAGVMLVEAVGVYLLVGMTSAAGARASTELVDGKADPAEQIVEIEMIKDKFQNRTTGRVWQWQIEVFLKVRQKNVEHVTGTLTTRKAELKEGVSKIISSALDRHLAEPGRNTIDRQLTAYVNEMFGLDAEGTPRVEDVLIPALSGTPAD